MANLKTVSKKSKAQSMGMHTEVCIPIDWAFDFFDTVFRFAIL